MIGKVRVQVRLFLSLHDTQVLLKAAVSGGHSHYQSIITKGKVHEGRSGLFAVKDRNSKFASESTCRLITNIADFTCILSSTQCTSFIRITDCPTFIRNKYIWHLTSSTCRWWVTVLAVSNYPCAGRYTRCCFGVKAVSSNTRCTSCNIGANIAVQDRADVSNTAFRYISVPLITHWTSSGTYWTILTIGRVTNWLTKSALKC